ncbi:unnamed protein product [Medioppia subpectinata]|uniref:Uncharacterized protein n=1 Tax=Medioppia subpectinata TaxID=1979941 RepID=A0A7R9Q7K2_9ACAR|nr:unnamed protein product [Medioppia subpectinata]CAG2115818.1 unnamed protein product [Medioppia subpectinata]
MPSILSKVLMPDWSVPYNCYEVVTRGRLHVLKRRLSWA